MEMLLKVLSTIIVFPLCIAGAVLMFPFAALCLLVSLPLVVLEDIYSTE